eukprot:Skav227122  [mRNA]  locus=scaffold199:548465:553934:+ [translate_table: standard]
MRPAARWNVTAAMCNSTPALKIAVELLASTPPSSGRAVPNPRFGMKGSNLEIVRGNAARVATPKHSGRRTISTADRSMPMESTGTKAPTKISATRGVQMTAPMVVVIVINTDNATSPPASRVKRLDAEPPLTPPINTKPTKKSCRRSRA